jgi:hypothetical protein
MEATQMIQTIFYFVFSFLFAASISWIIKENGNPANLTLRGRRVVFVFSIIIGFAIALFVTHFNVDCDLRSGANTPCFVGFTN